MSLVEQETRCEKFNVYLDAKNGDYRSLKIFGLLSRYPKDVREASVFIVVYPNCFKNRFDCRQEGHKFVQILLIIPAYKRLDDPMNNVHK